ncbi:ASPIC/UnbV domain protein [Enhygromyxa salina]|uniref:ASPIC/UnbV domain protein n=1 Tax=Enhygromyxa salina TaxID=215803 RepID=A0A0C2A3X4_9BACT|nr:CRTAC1 family protein [Enhygromyxa salina]KIG18088.1 ASPIC/UnbV domain protein [Enhygromyxa salina]
MRLRTQALLSLALVAIASCRGPLPGQLDADTTGDGDGHGDGDPPETGSDDTGDGDAECLPWPASTPALGMGETTALSFVDVTLEAGLLDTAYYPGDWPPTCDPAGEGWVGTPCKMYLQGGGAAVGDFDDDGWPDIYLTRLVGRDLLFRNMLGEGGEPAFQEIGASVGLVHEFGGNGAAWVDVDGDDDLDLYVTTLALPGRYWFYRNELAETGEASFVEQGIERGLALDDGLPHFGFSIGVGDYDRDGWLDLYTSEWWPGGSPTPTTHHARLLRNLGPGQPGSFEDLTLAADASMLMINPAGMHAFSPTFVDLDEDGWQDLAVVSDNNTSRLFWNRADGTFVDGTPKAGVSIERNGMGSTFGDVDGDGHLDWYVSAIFSPNSEIECGNPICGTGGNRLYRSIGPRCFEELGETYGLNVGGWGWGTTLWDPDNDGDLDIVECNGFQVPHGPPFTAFTSHPLRFWRNGSELFGQPEFAEQSSAVGLSDTGQGRGLVAFDYDRDGDQDLLVVDNSGKHGTNTKLWRNRSDEAADPNHWLAIELHGNAGNRQGVGARVELQRDPGGPAQVRVIGVNSHFLGHGEYRAHFGLGPSNEPVARVRVIWPSGAESSIEDVSVGQLLELPEP